MPDWKKPEDYEYPDDLDRCGWTWEFLRRNPEYRQEFEKSQKLHLPIYDPPKHKGESDNAWMHRVIREDRDPKQLHPYVYYAIKWRMQPPIHDPENNQPPVFLSPFPVEAHRWDHLSDYYINEADEAPTTQRTEYSVLVFDLRRPIKEQLRQARLQLKVRESQVQKSEHRNLQPSQWQIYLRLLDAKEAGAGTKDIIQNIDDYAVLPNSAADGYIADDRVSDNLQAARKLMNNPLSILK